ncbi:MAG: hypothetical protein CME60_07350 [Halobacteriovoraceae bacterium]|nr:hypothetical protein [Halobacteriovoraceae bacterium]
MQKKTYTNIIIHKNFLQAFVFINAHLREYSQGLLKLYFFKDDFAPYSKRVKAYRDQIFKDYFSSYLNDFQIIEGRRNLESINFEGTTHLFTLDAFYERNLFLKLKTPSKFIHTSPYLLSQLDKESKIVLSSKQQFTPFKNLYESQLPQSYNAPFLPLKNIQSLQKVAKYFKGEYPSHYFETRNQLIKNDENDFFSTHFSDLLAWGLIDVRYLYNLVRNYEKNKHKNKSTYWHIFEFLWRDFFYWLYKDQGASLYSKNGLKGEPSFFKQEGFDEKLLAFEHPFMKASFNELSETGYLSNRTRQLFASYWINELDRPWWQGALLFERYLIDYDPYSNYGNWMYLGGKGVDPRGKRHFRLENQLERYDPENKYIRHWNN